MPLDFLRDKFPMEQPPDLGGKTARQYMDGYDTRNISQGSPYDVKDIGQVASGLSDSYLSSIMELPMMAMQYLMPEDTYEPGVLQSGPQDRMRAEDFAWQRHMEDRSQDAGYATGQDYGTGLGLIADPFIDAPLMGVPALGKALKLMPDASAKTAGGLMGALLDESGAIKAQRGEMGSLIAQHNLSQANLAHAEKMGGIPVPSLAINKADDALTGFGDISLIADKNMIDPRGPNRTKVFGADVYSPRYPSIDYKTTYKKEEALKEKLSVYEGEIGANWSDYPGIADRGRDAVENSGLAMADFLTNMGEKIPKAREVDTLGKRTKKIDSYKTKNKMRKKIEAKYPNEFQQYIDDTMYDVVDEERLFQGFTYSGTRKYKPHTLENVTKQMKKDLRGGEGFNYGPGSLRAQFTPEFKNIKQIKDNEGRLMSKEKFNDLKDEISDDMFALYEDMKPHMKYENDNQFMNYDQFQEQIGEVSSKGIRGVMNEYFPDAPSSEGVANFVSKLADYPTEYFEANITRAVGIDEFSAAVVPTGTPQKVIDSLKKKGLKVTKYKKGDETARKSAISKLKDLRFAVMPAAMLGDIEAD